MPDLADALALAQEGRDALTGSPGLPLCFFNPLHGHADLRTGWRPLGRRDRLDVVVCRACADALREHRAPEVLTDTDESGRTVPYFEVPAARGAWAATGYGSLMPRRAVSAGRADQPGGRSLRWALNRARDRPSSHFTALPMEACRTGSATGTLSCLPRQYRLQERARLPDRHSPSD